MTPRAIDISLPRLLCRTVPNPTRAELTHCLGDPAPLHVVRAAFVPALAGWLSSVDAATGLDRAPLIRALNDSAESGAPLAFNFTTREDQGGRRYCFLVPGYDGPLVASRRGHAALVAGCKPRALLQAVPGALRGAIAPSPGTVFIDVDASACFLAIAAALSHDDRLASDLDGDVHAKVGAALAGRLDPDRQRRVGKLINNSMVGGSTAFGLRDHLVEAGLDVSLATAERLHARWWGRYPAFAHLLARVRRLIADRVDRRQGITILRPDGSCFRFSPAEVAGTVLGPSDNPAAARAHAVRSVISSLFRAIEGVALDRTLRHLVEHRPAVRLVLPMYDGLLAAVRADRAEQGRAVVADCLRQGFADVGVLVKVTCDLRARWGAK